MQVPEQDSELVDYYRRRASYYEAIYALPERQADLSLIKKTVTSRFEDARVLEVACGTGYWTTSIASVARSVVATDLADEPVEVAKAKPYPKGNVRFVMQDAYALGAALGGFDAAFAGFWWSHIPRQRIDEFLDSLHARLEPGARVLMFDNVYIEGTSTPVAGADRDGNTFQMRKLNDGTRVRVLKNFTTEEELRRKIAPRAAAFSYTALEYYWLIDYRLQ